MAQETLRDDMALVLAVRDGRYVAGALNFVGPRDDLTAATGAAWSTIPACISNCATITPSTIAIEHGLARVEAGAQGEHKLARGYLPMPCHSLHWIRDPGFAHAVEEYLEAERAAVEEEIEILTSYGPFRKVEVEEQQ